MAKKRIIGTKPVKGRVGAKNTKTGNSRRYDKESIKVPEADKKDGKAISKLVEKFADKHKIKKEVIDFKLKEQKGTGTYSREE